VASAALEEWIDLAANPQLHIGEPHLDWLRALAAAGPDEAGAREIRAACQEKDPGRRRAALEKLAAAADVHKLPARTLTRLASRLRAAQSTDMAVQLLRRARRQYPADFWVNHDLGSALGQTQPPRWAEAARYLTAAVALRPNSPGVHVNLGLVLRQGGQLGEAIACFQQALTLAPNYAGAHLNLGNALASKGQVDGAIACYRQAIDIDPDYAVAHNNLGNVLAAQRRADEAIASYRKAIDIDPDYAMAHYNLGNVLTAQRRPEEAIACYRKAIDIDPDYALAYTGLGNALAARRQPDEAIACYRKALDIDPKVAEAHTNLGNVLAARRQTDEAIACYRKAIESDPKFALAHYNLGIMLMARRDVDGAIACYRKAIASDPKLAEAHTNLGLALAGKGQVDEAIACYRKAIEVNPTLAQAFYNLGIVLMARGQLNEAREAFDRALEFYPTKHPTRAAVTRQLQTCRRLLKLGERLPRILRGEDQARSAGESLEFARLCQLQRRHAAAARFFASAFAPGSELAEDLKASHLSKAACAAALAAAGQGEDAARLDEKERARLRQQALGWLRADLALRRKALQQGRPGQAAAARAALRNWQTDSALASLRAAEGLKDLPAAEQQAWRSFWADVRNLLGEMPGEMPYASP
jgi:tetratricopeptide (TPR) repeat protein